MLNDKECPMTEVQGSEEVTFGEYFLSKFYNSEVKIVENTMEDLNDVVFSILRK